MKEFKKFLALLLTLCLIVALTACGEAKEENKSAETQAQKEETVQTSDHTSVSDISATAENDVNETIEKLESEYSSLKSEITTYEVFLQSENRLTSFYQLIVDEHNTLNIRMREYALDMARVIIDSYLSNDDKYDEVEEIYDTIYENCGDDIYDEIYDGILDDIYNLFYDGILDKAYDNADYSQWSNARSDEYERWSDSRSDVYDSWSDFRSDVYDFWSDLRSDLYQEKTDRLEKTISDFQDAINKLNGVQTESETTASIASATVSVDTVEGIIQKAQSDVESTIEEITSSCEALTAEISSFDSYISNEERISSFYQTIEDSHEELCSRIKGYALNCAKMIINDNHLTIKEKYKKINVINDDLYDDCLDDIENGFYDELFDFLEDSFYEGVLKDGNDNTNYADWYYARSNEYSQWYDARSDVYSTWYDTRSDVYEFWYDLRDELYSEDLEKANKVIQKYENRLK